MTPAFGDSKRANVAISIEPLQQGVRQGHDIGARITNRVVLDEGWQLRIWHNSVEGAIDLSRNSTSNLQVLNFALEATWFHEARELRLVREMAGHYD